MRDAFHQATVADEGIGEVVDDGQARAVELGRQQRLGQRHAHGVRHALAQRAGGGLDPGVMPTSGWPGVLECIWRKLRSSSMDRS